MPRLQRRLTAVLFTDVIDSVRLTRLDPDGHIGRWRAFVAAVLRDDLPPARGRMVKHTGDGMLVEFESVVDAVECGLAMQARIELGNADLPADRQVHLRIGIHIADVLADDIDLYGDGVNLAARLMSLGGPREVVISAAVRDQLADGLGVTLEDLGERQLKGVARPVRAFRAWPLGALPNVHADRARRLGDRPSIAVLPFRNPSRDPAHEFLGDLLAEDVIGHLSRLTDLFVISRLSTTPFRDRLYEPRNVADVLGVRYVLSGSMLAAGTQLQVIAELTEADVGRVIWSDRIRGSMDDIFELQEALATEIARRVVPYLRQVELQRARLKSAEHLTAYEWMLRAIENLHGTSRAGLDAARRMLETAIAGDPTYAAPQAWLARWHVLRVGQGWSPDRGADVAEANRHAKAALALDPNDPWSLAVHGLVSGYLNKDLATAIEDFDRALAINPSAASAWAWSTAAYAWLGRGDEAVARAHRAEELSPLDPHRYVFTSLASTAHAVAGRYDDAIALARRSLRENRMYASTHRLLVISLALAGHLDEAKRAAADLLALEPGLTVCGFRERYPGSGSAHAELFCAALAQAGVPA
jgi:TolB-like protein/class 3 adenylate cyclase/Flp pilus assembly protein TadD